MSAGQSVANAIIAMCVERRVDELCQLRLRARPGDWQPTAPSFMPAENPQWATLKPFAMTSDSQFRPGPPPALSSQEYADDVNETLELGAVNSTTRTADETQIARFWNDGAGTYTPPGHWNAIAEQVAQQQGDSLSQDARLFAELNIAEGDAAIVAWDAKYTYNTWRPIQLAGGAGTAANSQIETIANWTPLINTPPFPEYISGHSTLMRRCGRGPLVGLRRRLRLHRDLDGLTGGHPVLHQLRAGRRGGRHEPDLRRHPLPFLGHRGPDRRG